MNVGVSHPTDRPNFSIVRLPNVIIWFSYETPIAFSTASELVICKNRWSRTTGKHLNYIDPDKSQRVPHEEFLQRLQEHMPLDPYSPNVSFSR